MTGPVAVEFLNLYGGSRVLRRQFANEATFVQWHDGVRSSVELLSVRPVPEASEVIS